MNKEQPEMPDDEDDNPFLNIAYLLEVRKVSVAALATEIEDHGIYTWDKFGRFGLADDDSKAEALRLLEVYYEWQNTPLQESSGDPRSPIDRWGCSSDNAYGHFGWRTNDVPDFNDNVQESNEVTNLNPPVDALTIRRRFAVFPSENENEEWWKKMMREALDNGLVDCRVGAGKKGPGGSLWQPALIAVWLVERSGKNLTGSMTSNSARAALKKFTGYEEAAEELFPSDDWSL